MGWVLPVSHQSSARLISLKGQPYSTLKSAFLVSKDFTFSVEMFEITAQDRAQPAQGLPSVIAKAWVLQTVWWLTPLLPALEKQRQEDEKFKVIFGYALSLKPARVTLDPASETNKQSIYNDACLPSGEALLPSVSVVSLSFHTALCSWEFCPI